MASLMYSAQFDTNCRIEIEQSPDHFHAHVELEGNLPIFPGDKVLVHGAPVQMTFGEKIVEDRRVTISRASSLRRAYTKVAGYLELAELYEVSFSAGRL